MDSDLNFLFRETETAYYKTLSVSLFLSSQITTLNADIEFIKGVLIEQNTDSESEKEFFKNAQAQKEQYKNALEKCEENLKLLHSQKFKLQNSLYDKSKPFIKNYLQIIEDKRKRLFIATEKDTSEYLTIDKRQSLTKADLNLFLKKLLLRGVISKNEFNKAKRYKIFSENIQSRVYFYFNHTLNKTGHKKHTLSNNKSNRAKYIYSPKFKRLIKFRSFAIHFKQSFINGEIKHKIRQEKKVYAYFKTEQ